MNNFNAGAVSGYVKRKMTGANRRFWRLKILEYLAPYRARRSYAQFGEDILIDSIFWYLHILSPTYLDIGAYSPVSLSNTYYFYKNGSHGVCVEPNPVGVKQFRRMRRRDLCLQAGVGAQDGEEISFYVLKEAALSTFDEASARLLEQRGVTRIQSVITVPVYSVNTMIERYCPRCPDLLSVDVEGMDLAVLQSLDFTRYRPVVIIVETIDFLTQAKDTEITDFLCSQDCRVQGDTVINTVFVDKRVWDARPSL